MRNDQGQIMEKNTLAKQELLWMESWNNPFS